MSKWRSGKEKAVAHPSDVGIRGATPREGDGINSRDHVPKVIPHSVQRFSIQYDLHEVFPQYVDVIIHTPHILIPERR